MVKEAGADMIKLDGAPQFPDAVRAISRAGIPVFCAVWHYSTDACNMVSLQRCSKPVRRCRGFDDEYVEEAKLLEDAGASLLDFTILAQRWALRSRLCFYSGDRGFGAAVAGWADADGSRRSRYAASNLDSRIENYANVANIVFDAWQPTSKMCAPGGRSKVCTAEPPLISAYERVLLSRRNGA